ncbi:class I SAM-dependent methyltransferase [Pseudomonas sp. CGJS7]|uniref:class I SAM-dependent methyltransferase n=1 Tax=Pseudomonas sp. CGJS7 TaxID=3109348 RepID=UPI00300A5FB6
MTESTSTSPPNPSGPATPRPWNMFDPADRARFVRNEPTIQPDASNEALLQNIVRLTDGVFDHLSVFEQFSETTSRGALADPGKKLDVAEARDKLIRAERELWQAYRILKDARESFVQRQTRALGIDAGTRGLKIHFGSSHHLVQDWLNIDAGGGDLMLNVNWGLPLPDGCADFAYSAHLLEHLRYHDQAAVFVREIHRVLAAGGTLRLVVPDVKKLLAAYAAGDREFFEARQEFYRLKDGFTRDGVANLDYILLFCGANQQVLSYNHKFGYDFETLRGLLLDAGFDTVVESDFQASERAELLVDDFSYNARARDRQGRHYSLFVEATKSR